MCGNFSAVAQERQASVFVEALKRCSVEAIDQLNALTVQRLNVISTSDLPALNASFNLLSAIFISMGWYFIRHGAWRRHMACMITAVISSACFLVGYIIYHSRVGEKSSGYTGWIAAFYFPILASHVLLAFVTLPLVILTLIQVFRRRWDRHKRIARWTIPIWLYVSITGVLVYLVLYKWFPPGT
jgi:uncharacterized membrane protein YozB (DUF420 family)